MLVNIWCILCFGDHHSIEKPPSRADSKTPSLLAHKFLLCAVECPIHPTITWVKAKERTLTIKESEIHPRVQVKVKSKKSRISIDQMGELKGYTFL